MLEDTIIAHIITERFIHRNIIMINMDRAGTIMAVHLRWRNMSMELAALTIITNITITITIITTTITITNIINTSMNSTKIHTKVAAPFLLTITSINITKDAATLTPHTKTPNQ